MSFFEVLKGALGVGESPSALPSRESPLFLYVKIPGHIEPLDRAERFEDPLQEALDAAGLGEITGGGSQLGEAGPDGTRIIEFCGIDVDLFALEPGLALLRRELTRLRAPVGTVLIYKFGEKKYEQPVHEA